MIAERKDLHLETLVHEMVEAVLNSPVEEAETPISRTDSIRSNLSDIKDFVAKQVDKENAKWFTLFTSLILIIIRLYTTL